MKGFKDYFKDSSQKGGGDRKLKKVKKNIPRCPTTNL